MNAAFATPPLSPYGGGPGAGITLPPYFRPTPSVKVGANFYPLLETLDPDEMRVTLVGTSPFPPRGSQAGTCIMVELGNGDRFFFDFGPGALRNLVALQVPVADVNDIFLTHLHVDHYGDLPYLYGFAPWTGRWKPLRLYGPSGRTKELGTRAMAEGLEEMTHWHSKAFSGVPVGDGYEIDVHEFDWEDDGGICYERNGVTVRHWRRSHGMSGAVGYRLDWNGLSFVWTGDGRPDELTVQMSEGVDVFVTEMQLDVPRIYSEKTGIPAETFASAIDNGGTSHFGAGYLFQRVKPRLAMATHFSLEHDLLNETVAGVRTHYKGLFVIGAPDGVVVNVTKDAVWTRDAVMLDAGNGRRASSESELRALFGGDIPAVLEIPQAKYNIAELVDEQTWSHEIPVEAFLPPDVDRPLVRSFPAQLAGKKIPLALLYGLKETGDARIAIRNAAKAVNQATVQLAKGLASKALAKQLRGPVNQGIDAIGGAWSKVLHAADKSQAANQARLKALQSQSQQSKQPHDGQDGARDRHGANLFSALATAAEQAHPETAAPTPVAIATDGISARGPYRTAPRSGLTIPDYYTPTPSVKNPTTFFPGAEDLGRDEMRITFAGSCPFPPRRDQAATCILLEFGNGERLIFDLGPGSLRNLIALQVPVADINDIFVSHLHVDHYGELPYLYGFGPWAGRWKPLRIHGPSGREPDEGIAHVVTSMQKMMRWHTDAFQALPVGDGFEVDVNEFDWEDDGGICFERNGITVRHWRRIHNMSGASGYRVDWNGLSFVWTGDGRPDSLTVEMAKGVDVFVTELQLNLGRLYQVRSGVPEPIFNLTIDGVHTDHYAAGYMIKQVNPRIGMVTHTGYDSDLLGEALAGVQAHWDGLFAFGAPDGVVVNVTKDAIWNRRAPLPEAANPHPAPDGPPAPKPKRTVDKLVDTKTRNTEIDAASYTPTRRGTAKRATKTAKPATRTAQPVATKRKPARTPART